VDSSSLKKKKRGLLEEEKVVGKPGKPGGEGTLKRTGGG